MLYYLAEAKPKAPPVMSPRPTGPSNTFKITAGVLLGGMLGWAIFVALRRQLKEK